MKHEKIHWLKRKEINGFLVLSLILLIFLPTSIFDASIFEPSKIEASFIDTSYFETDDPIGSRNLMFTKSIGEESGSSSSVDVESIGISSELNEQTVAIIAAAATVEAGNLPETPLFHPLSKK
jgi:hypothetical protein